MAIFNYHAKDTQGGYHKGSVEATDQTQVANILRKKKLIVLSIKKQSAGSLRFFNEFFNRVSFADVVVITRQLATMVGSGLVLSEALDIIQDQQTNPTLKKALVEVSSDLKGGLDFASALEKHPQVFSPLYAKLIRAGQASGKLDTIMLQLATNLEKEREFRSRVRGAMIYPIIVVTMMIGVMLIMVFFVMPKLMGLYKDSGLELPLPTKILIIFSSLMIDFWWVILLVIVVGGVAIRRYLKTAKGKLLFDSTILKIPIAGRIVSLVVMTTFTRTFALLISSGVSILEAIKIVSGIVDNLVYQSALEVAYKGVERGLNLSNQLLAVQVFPKIIGQMIKTGEETGKLDEVMFKIADYFEEETDESLKNVTTLIEPIVLVLLGIGVAFLVISIILPIYQLTTNIK